MTAEQVANPIPYTTYMRETDGQTRATCVQSIARLKDELDALQTAYAHKRAKLEARITNCQDTINRIDERSKKTGL